MAVLPISVEMSADLARWTRADKCEQYQPEHPERVGSAVLVEVYGRIAMGKSRRGNDPSGDGSLRIATTIDADYPGQAAHISLIRYFVMIFISGYRQPTFGYVGHIDSLSVDHALGLVSRKREGASYIETNDTLLAGTIIPAGITALTSWWNRDTARAQLEAERLRQHRDDQGRSDPC